MNRHKLTGVLTEYPIDEGVSNNLSPQK
ncbi:MAG: hypothetical protein ACN6PN_17000 [Sphingobacterium sp.]